jgi:uncharacterized SAM-binding protein YcdF (DUF218 family)
MISRMTRRKKWFLKIAAALLALAVLLAAACFFFPKTFLCVDSGPARADVIVVLGGSTAHERALRAIELYQQQAAPRILISGAGDAEINRRIFLRNGIPASAIQVESKSRTTQQNAVFSLQILRAENVHSAIIVTTWYHSRRALHTFEHFGDGIKFYSRPSYFWTQRSEWRDYFFRHVYLEYAKLPGYWVAYGVCPF